MYELIYQKTIHSYWPKWPLSIFFQVLIILWMYNFGHLPNSAVTLPHLLLREKSRNFPAQKTVKLRVVYLLSCLVNLSHFNRKLTWNRCICPSFLNSIVHGGNKWFHFYLRLPISLRWTSVCFFLFEIMAYCAAWKLKFQLIRNYNCRKIIVIRRNKRFEAWITFNSNM